jgi:hypothetical protein
MVLEVVLEVEVSVSLLTVLLAKRVKESLELYVGENLLTVLGVLEVVLADVCGKTLSDCSAGEKSSIALTKERAELVTDANRASDTALSGATSSVATTSGALCLLLVTADGAYELANLTGK